MKFAEQIPNHRKYLELQIGKVQREIAELNLGQEHAGCECEYCPYADAELDEDAAAQIEELNATESGYKSTLKALDAYAKLVGAEATS